MMHLRLMFITVPPVRLGSEANQAHNHVDRVFERHQSFFSFQLKLVTNQSPTLCVNCCSKK